MAVGSGTYLYLDAQATIDDANCPDSRCVEGIGDPELSEIIVFLRAVQRANGIE